MGPDCYDGTMQERWRQLALTVVLVVVSVAGLINVFADNADVVEKANRVAFGDQGDSCRPQMTRLERTPFSQGFGIVTAKRTVDVRCRRSAIFFGSYSCQLE